MKGSYLRFNKSIIMMPVQIISYLDQIVDHKCGIKLSNSSFFIAGQFLTYDLISNEVILQLDQNITIPENVGLVSVHFESHRIKFRSIVKEIRHDKIICGLPTVLFNGTVYQRDSERIEGTDYLFVYQDKIYPVNNLSLSGLNVQGLLDCFINEKIEFKLRNSITGLIEDKIGIVIHYTNECTGIQLCQQLN